jgi:hypothetical protein
VCVSKSGVISPNSSAVMRGTAVSGAPYPGRTRARDRDAVSGVDGEDAPGC